MGRGIPDCRLIHMAITRVYGYDMAIRAALGRSRLIHSMTPDVHKGLKEDRLLYT